MADIKFYYDKRKAIRKIGQTLFYTFCGLVILFIINYLAMNIFNRYAVPHILLAPAFIVIIYIYRSSILLFLPFLVISNSQIKFFNILWYKTKKWEQIEGIKYFEKEKTLHIEKKTGRVLGSIDMDELNDKDIAIAIDWIKGKCDLIILPFNPLKSNQALPLH